MKGRKEGMEADISKNAIETANKLKQIQLPIEQIATATNLTLAELDVLFKNN
jgi:predicted transposase YdaD